MSNWKCGGCGHVYSFDEWINLLKVPDRDGKALVCKHCGYVFGKDKPLWKTYGEINHRITVLDWVTHLVDIEISTVFLELAHDDYDFGDGKREPNYYESMFFCHKEGERVYVRPPIPDNYDELSRDEQMKAMIGTWTDGVAPVECWLQHRYQTEEQAIKGHKRLTKLLEEGKYLIRYAFEKRRGSKYRVTWRIDFHESYRRILHGAKVHREWEGTGQEYREDRKK